MKKLKRMLEWIKWWFSICYEPECKGGRCKEWYRDLKVK